MPRTATAIVGAAALIAATFSVPLVASAAASGDDITVPSQSEVKDEIAKYSDGLYIVSLKDQPVVTYSGGIAGFAATKITKGKQLNVRSNTVEKYSSYLEKRQDSLASKVGVEPLYNYTVVNNGFAAKLTGAEAAQLSKSDGVVSVTPNEILHVTQESSLEFLDISTPYGTWDQLGGIENAGEGVVVGVIDTGIAPENPSFEGDPLGTTAGTEPYLSDADTITYAKSDGTDFTSDVVAEGPQWDASYYSTKIVGANYYLEGFGAGNIGTAAGDLEYASPRDGGGHGSHTASTAAGNPGIAASVEDIPFGDISGVAPEAKIAAYKACWTGNEAGTTEDDGCATLDLVAAINQAVADGVDVINYSIGGGSATTVISPTDEAFLNAAAAGIFVAASAGNSGPADSTLDNAAPWETTVAASTIPDYEGTVELGNGEQYAGATVTVRTPLSGDFVDAKTNPKVNTATGIASAAICLDGSLDEAAVDGTIVLCERGVNDRVAKSAEVERAGGIGMVLVNVAGGADDVDNDFHTVPTVHVSNVNQVALHDYAATADATVTLLPTNEVGETPVPQLAGFSSHGPVLAAGSDTIKPDIAAPGVSILAAVANAEGEDGNYAFYNGTSMAAPHIAGLAALYLSQDGKATASPMEIKSAIMTTAGNLKDSAGADYTDPFGQGAGQVHPQTFLEPGLVYTAGIGDWLSYLVGAEEIGPQDGVEPIDPSDLNQASIGIGDLLNSQTVTRAVTATTAGTYTAEIDVPGIETTVTPSTVDLEVGETAEFTVTFTRTTAEQDAYTSGFLTWTGDNGITVRSPVAVHPTSAFAPTAVSGTGTTGSASIDVVGGYDGDLPITVEGLTKGDFTKNAADPSLPYTGIATGNNGPDDFADAIHYIPEGTETAQFDVYPTKEDPATDFDLYVLALDEAGEPIALAGQSATGSASESVTLQNPPAGYYLSETVFYATPTGGVPYIDVAYSFGLGDDVGSLAASPSTLPITIDETSSTEVSWSGLDYNSLYKGTLFYGEAKSVSSDLSVATEAAPEPTPTATATATATPTPTATGTATPTPTATPTATPTPTPTLVNTIRPRIVGTALLATTVRANTGTWNLPSSGLTFTYQWTANGKAIKGATKSSLKLGNSLLGDSLGVTVTARSGVLATSATSVPHDVRAVSRTTVFLSDSTINTRTKEIVTVRVAANGSGKETGTVVVHYGSKTKKDVMHSSDSGTVRVVLPTLEKGSYKIWAEFRGNDNVAPDRSITKNLRVR